MESCGGGDVRMAESLPEVGPRLLQVSQCDAEIHLVTLYAIIQNYLH